MISEPVDKLVLEDQKHSCQKGSNNDSNTNICSQPNHTTGKPTNEYVVEEESFSISLDIPGVADQIKIQVSNNDTVFEIKQMIMESMDTSLRTCFSLVIDKNTKVDDYAKISEIAGIHDGSVIRLVDDPYNLREAFFHISRFNDILISSNAKESLIFSEPDGLSPVCLDQVLGYNPDLSEPNDIKLDENDIELLAINQTPTIVPLLLPLMKKNDNIKCLDDLQLAPWNPPVGPRKFLGDLLYLIVKTLEGKTVYISCCVNGFFINRSNDGHFDPAPMKDSYRSYTLVGLLSQVSDKFKFNFGKLVRSFVKKNVYEYAHSSNLDVKLWTVPFPTNEKNSIRASEFLSSITGLDDVQSSQLRDWNEELQTVRQLKKTEISDRILRDRSTHRVIVDMAQSARKGVKLLMEGSLRSMNPHEKLKDQLFVWNNLFFSISSDTKGYFKHLGGDIATKSATLLDLHGVDMLNRLGLDDVFTLGTTVVDYYGHRVLTQSIVPGIFQKNSDDVVAYGCLESTDSAIKSSDQFNQLLNGLKENLKIRPAEFINPVDDQPVKLNSSIESKGIIGSDGRHYLIDVYRLLPPDPLFIDEKPQKTKYFPNDFTFASDYAKLTYDFTFSKRRFSNKMRVFREILVDEFYSNEYRKFLKIKETNFEKLQKEALIDLKEKSKEQDVKLSREMLSEFEETANKNASLSCNLPENSRGYDLAVSPDCFNSKLKIRSNEEESMSYDRSICHRISYYMVSCFIPDLVSQLNNHVLYDGNSLTKLFHSKGINMRYLGYFNCLLVSSPISSIQYIHRICVSEMIIRAGKLHFRSLLAANVRKFSTCQIIAHYLNCFLGSNPCPKASNPKDEVKISRRGARKNKTIGNTNGYETRDVSASNWSSLTPDSLWAMIKSTIMDKFGYHLNCNDIQQLCKNYRISCVSLLRRFCQVHGLQLVSREYDFESSKHHTFFSDDIIDMIPLVKTVNVLSVDALSAINLAKQYISTNNLNLLKLAYNILSATSAHLAQIYGLIHPQLAIAYELLSKIAYVSDDLITASMFQKKAVLIYERYYGIDHYDTIHSYINLGLYLCGAKCIVSAIKVLNRAKYLITLAFGSDHPEIVTIDTNLALSCSMLAKNSTSIQLLENALQIQRFWLASSSSTSLNYGTLLLLLAKQQVWCSHYKEAINNSKSAFKIFKTLNGSRDHFTVEASSVMEAATKLAVTSERLSKAISTGEFSSSVTSKNNYLCLDKEDFNLFKAFNHLRLGSAEVLIEKPHSAHTSASQTKPVSPIGHLEIDVD